MTEPSSTDPLRNLSVVAAPGLTKYARLRQAIIQRIEEGGWKPGDQLPPEKEIARRTSLSLGTVQRALRSLADEGLVVRSQGSGTFVTEHRTGMEAPWHCRFLNEDGSGFLPVYPKLILRERTTNPGEWTDFLAPFSGTAIRLDRRLSIGDEFYVYSKLYMDEGRFAKMLKLPTREINAANLKTLIQRIFQLTITQISQCLAFTEFPTEIAKAIDTAPNATGIRMECLAKAGPSLVVYYQELYIPPNGRRLVVSDSDNAWLGTSRPRRR